MILGTLAAAPHADLVQRSCGTAFSRTIASVRALIQMTGVLLDEVSLAAPAIRQSIHDRLVDLATISAEVQTHPSTAPAQRVAHLAAQLCAIAVTADNLGTQFSSVSAVDQAHRDFLDIIDIMLVDGDTDELPTPMPKLPTPVVLSTVPSLMVAGGLLVALVGVATIYYARRF